MVQGRRMNKRQRGIFGLRVLAVVLMTVLTLILTILLMFQAISTTVFIAVFAVWYLITAIFMLATGGLSIKDPPDESHMKDYDDDHTE